MTAELSSLPAKVVLLDEALAAADLPHAFGGALALAWCTERARGTIDIDVNVFVSGDEIGRVFAALPDGVTISEAGRSQIAREGQARLWWDDTPIDIFLNTLPFHEQVGMRAVLRRFGDRTMPFLSCRDLAVFKAFFDRTKDWADLEAMYDAGVLDVDRLVGTLIRFLGVDDHRVRRALELG